MSKMGANGREIPQWAFVATDVAPPEPRDGTTAWCWLRHDVKVRYKNLTEFYAPSRRLAEVDIDLLWTAAVVAYADRHARRRRGGGWARSFQLQIPVHEPDRWNARDVRLALADTLSFVSGDAWEITFTPRVHADDKAFEQQLLPPPADIRTVMPYSGGLDSFAAFSLLDRERDGTPLLVTSRAAADVGRVAGDSSRASLLTAHEVQVPISAGSGPHSEPTYRTRTFMYFSVAAVAAHLVGAEKLIVAENGQGALGPSIVPFGGEHPFRTTHPGFTARFRRFVNRLFSTSLRVEHPALWKTKAELLEDLRDANLLDGVKATRSCSQPIWKTKRVQGFDHCGICGGCLLRRMSLRSAGLHDLDAGKPYLWSDLQASDLADAMSAPNVTTTDLDRETALYALMDLKRLADAAVPGAATVSISRTVFELSAALGIPEAEVEAKLSSLLSRHRRDWDAFVASMGSDSWPRLMVGS